MRLCVTGGRAYSDRAHVNAVLDAMHGRTHIVLLIHGKSFGADMLADHWARRNMVPTLGFQAEWDRLGKAAGPVRNRVMLREGKPDIVLAFPGGYGTRNCVGQARALGIEVIEVAPGMAEAAEKRA
jgi:hypothetical protein